MLTVVLLALLLAATPALARIPASKQAWQYRWHVWLPDKWRRLGMCETGMDWRHDSNGANHYVSAFGIEAGNYAADARYAGTPQWWRQPTPWAQYRTALAHYRLHGGFSGWGCRDA